MADAPRPTMLDLNRMLVVKLADHGDAVLATSAVAALRSTFPQARIDVLTAATGAAVFQMCDAVDRILILDKRAFDNPAGLMNPVSGVALIKLAAILRQQHYDAVVLLHHLTTHFGAQKFHWLCRVIGAPLRAGLDNGRGEFLTHRATDYGFGTKSAHEYGLDVVSLLGADTRNAKPSITVPDSARLSARELLARHQIGTDYVVIHPGVGGFSSARNWYPDRFAVVARTISQRHGLPCVLVGADDSTEAGAEISRHVAVASLIGSTTFAELAAVLDAATLVIGADSGVVHLAAALDTPTIAIFGPSNHTEWTPFGAQTLSSGFREIPSGSQFVVRSDLPCSPCFYSGYGLGRRNGCALRTCLSEIVPTDVAQIATSILGRRTFPKSTTC